MSYGLSAAAAAAPSPSPLSINLFAPQLYHQTPEYYNPIPSSSMDMELTALDDKIHLASGSIFFNQASPSPSRITPSPLFRRKDSHTPRKHLKANTPSPSFQLEDPNSSSRKKLKSSHHGIESDGLIPKLHDFILEEEEEELELAVAAYEALVDEPMQDLRKKALAGFERAVLGMEEGEPKMVIDFRPHPIQE